MNRSDTSLTRPVSNGLITTLCCLLLLSWLEVANASVQIGSVVFAKGAVSARSTEGTVRLLARESSIFENDTIATADNSFAVVRFADETKMSIRPNSEIMIEHFNEKVGEEQAEFNLLKGGLRAITGAIGKRNPESVRFKTRKASIGIRGTDLAIRDCEGTECQEEEESMTGFDPVKTNCASSVEGQPPGLYFVFTKGAGYAEKDGKRVELVAIGAGYASNTEMSCLSQAPRFILNDEYLEKINVDWQEAEFFEMLGIDDDQFPACEIL
ncbi:MAG: hypothetical protein DHS20C01_18150 [marine bacterium B5-7]|nr:MAG: hypothetical protein DHS20C01_18150 [marine bacterium B5-7]